MIYEIFLQAMISLQKYFGKYLDDSMLEFYWKNLQSLSLEQFKKSLENIIDTFKPTSQTPFPLISHFKEAVGLSGKNRAQLAIMAIKLAGSAYNTVSFGDYALHNTVNRFGGWPTVSRWSCEDWKFQEKNFIACYEAMQGCAYGPEKLPGIFEIENGNKCLSEKHLEIAKEKSCTCNISWVGFTDLKQLENKKDDVFLLEKLSENIGKKVA